MHYFSNVKVSLPYTESNIKVTLPYTGYNNFISHQLTAKHHAIQIPQVCWKEVGVKKQQLISIFFMEHVRQRSI